MIVCRRSDFQWKIAPEGQSKAEESMMCLICFMVAQDYQISTDYRMQRLLNEMA